MAFLTNLTFGWPWLTPAWPFTPAMHNNLVRIFSLPNLAAVWHLWAILTSGWPLLDSWPQQCITLWSEVLLNSYLIWRPSLGELAQRHIPNFSVKASLGAFGVRWRYLTSMTPNLASLMLNFSSLTMIWCEWRQFGIMQRRRVGVNGADLVPLSPSDSIRRQTMPSDAKWYQRHQNHHFNQIMLSTT